MKLTGADILIECLKEQKVDTVFGYPGGAVLNIYDALHKNSDSINHYLTAHEQGAAHAADGYARSTGKVGVCIATSGPGATNLVTGIATAYIDSVPMVAFTGNVPTALLGKDSFQEVNIVGITKPVTKANFQVKNVDELADVIREAFRIAQSGRKGPVLVDIPKDVTATEAEYNFREPEEIKHNHDTFKVECIEEALELIEKSERPYIYAGGGIIHSGATEELMNFAEKIDSPVGCSLMGQGGFPASHENYTGMIGMHGTKTSNMGVSNCDLLIALGARFSDRVISNVEKFATKAQILHIDIDPKEIGKNVKTYHHIIGDLKEILSQINQRLDKQNHKEWLGQVQQWKKEFPLTYVDHEEKISGPYVVQQLDKLTEGDAIITTEVGQNQIWAAQFYNFDKPSRYISSGGMGTMGYGTGACIGAKVGNPDRICINVAGDGSFRMNCNEMSTIVHYNLPVIICVLNNSTLGMVRQWQTLFYGKRYSETTLDRGPDFVKLAEAYGAKGFRVETKKELDEAIKKAIEINGPVILDCIIDEDEKVYPIVPPGKPIDELVLSDED